MPDPLVQKAMTLHQAGRLPEAAALYEEVLRLSPLDAQALYGLGVIQFQTGRFAEAEAILARVLRLSPRAAKGWCTRGLALIQLHRREEAIACFDSALSLAPDFFEAMSSRATALLELGRLDQALAAFDRVLSCRADHAISWNNRGNVFIAMRKLAEAVPCFEKALALDPTLTIAENNLSLALLELKRIRRVPPHAVRLIFEDYSPHYDRNMLEDLRYRGHVHVRALADLVVPELKAPMCVLDLGCGTGLSGMAFQDVAAGGRLDGIDLSERMIGLARGRGIYDALTIGDFETILSEPGPDYDLIIAADSFIYHGDLAPVLDGALKHLKSQGFLIFTVEGTQARDWELTSANRFRHSEAYVRNACAREGLEFCGLMECSIREESSQPVPGFAVAIRKH
jgi:predicted TPR repeat methyltransferase